MNGRVQRNPLAGLLALLAVAAVVIPLLASAGSPPSSSGHPPAAPPPAAPPPAATAPPRACPPKPQMLSPKGGAGSRFTMLIRINKPENVVAYANPDEATGGLARRIRPRDIFVVNTRFAGSSPSEAEQIVAEIGRSFPCNRIVALNGLGSDPARPGYALSLADSAGVWGLMLDWERRDWRAARATNPKMSRWKRRFGHNLKRLGAWMGDVATAVAASPGPSPKRVGVIPAFEREWDYGKIARAIDARHRRLGQQRGGIQAVMTQVACQRGGARGMGRRAHRVLRDYRRAKRKRRNLALQISFSDTPIRGAKLPVRSVSPGAAAKCTRAALRRGGGPILFWASPESMRALFSVKRVARLRRP
jgi:hypothetical protein